MDYAALGKRVREERRKKDLTQEKLAEAVHVSYPYIGQIERGERGVALDTLVEICNFLGVTVDYLLSDYYTISETEYYKVQWAKLMKDSLDFEQEYILKIVEAAIENMSDMQEKWMAAYKENL